MADPHRLRSGGDGTHPAVVVPTGFTSEGMPTSLCFIGPLYGESQTLAVAKTYQEATDFHRRHPPL